MCSEDPFETGDEVELLVLTRELLEVDAALQRRSGQHDHHDNTEQRRDRAGHRGEALYEGFQRNLGVGVGRNRSDREELVGADDRAGNDGSRKHNGGSTNAEPGGDVL